MRVNSSVVWVCVCLPHSLAVPGGQCERATTRLELTTRTQRPKPDCFLTCLLASFLACFSCCCPRSVAPISLPRFTSLPPSLPFVAPAAAAFRRRALKRGLVSHAAWLLCDGQDFLELSCSSQGKLRSAGFGCLVRVDSYMNL